MHDNNKWVLRVQIDGEWEEARYNSKADALPYWDAVLSDYQARVREAILISPQGEHERGLARSDHGAAKRLLDSF